ncbi:hypothetical protein ACX8XN_02260 [Calditrichota bacterium GD2]
MVKRMRWAMIISIIALFVWQCDDNGTGGDNNEKNVPGEILWVSVPDSIQVPPAGFFHKALVTAAVADSNGLDDVDSVYFYSKKPDGSLANNGLPLVMVDNGKPFNINNPWEEAGDETAGDGIYSLTILIDNSAQTGRYYFTFYMRDKAGNLSDSVTDSIEVYQ